jgi:hypothetical protein
MLFFQMALATTLGFAAPAPAKKVPDNTSCAKMSLSAMYGAEKSYYSEYNVYSDTYDDIGFSPEPGECPSWSGSIRLFSGGQEFLATYTKPSTGETWTINEKKELRQEDPGKTSPK